ncbi:hypothetical protein R6L23_24410, partial [Streptomyces sp. SR27]|nr:hypothetical protein [Streptomyces sp. SR27]
MARTTSATALLTASAVLTGLVQAVPAAADTVPEEDTGWMRSSVGYQRRVDRCLAGEALHYGGPLQKARAIQGLTGTQEELRATVISADTIGYGPLGQAFGEDGRAAQAYSDMVGDRRFALQSANDPYVRSAWESDAMEWHAPAFGADVTRFTLETQARMSNLGSDEHSVASPEAIAKAKEVAKENEGKDAFHDMTSGWMLSDDQINVRGYAYGTTATDVAAYLKRGGFPALAPLKDSAEYRVEVEDQKQAWSACDSQNPFDPRRVLNEPVMTAMVEWELEYAGQSGQRAKIMHADADAAAATREATDDMIEAIGQAWAVDQILTWRKYWTDKLAQDPNTIFEKPDQAFYAKADADLARYRSNIAALVTSAQAHAGTAATAAQTAVTAQQEAWAVADTTHVPRGRGLMYAQQSVQVARASAAAATAAAKATETALAAA